MINTKCLFGEYKIIFCPYFSAINFLIVAGINHNNEFVNELVLYFYKSNFLDKYIILINLYEKLSFSINIKFNNNESQIFLESTNTHIGTAYKIKEKDDSKLSREMEDEIFILIKIYLFNLDLKNGIFLTQANADSKNYEKYIKTEKCYLINTEWLDEFKKYYL